MTTDPEVRDREGRRETPLATKLKARIRREGPLTVAEYMQACLQDPEHGYYVRQTAIGRAGDFITAPEISQVFGELAGLWAAVVWQQMGAPGRLNLVELGPGRGTLMADALRAARTVPGFLAAVHIHLVESSETLRKMQENALVACGAPVTFHTRLKRPFWDETIRDAAPMIVIANEFLDTFPVQQFVFDGHVWRERRVSLDAEGEFTFTIDTGQAFRPQSLPDAPAPEPGAIHETSVDLNVFGNVYFGACAETQPFAALLFDYGHSRTGFGDTLQAVAGHRHVSPFHAPGESDLTAHVDFQQFGDACRRAADGRLAVDGPVTQGAFLGALGIVERASRLMEANPSKAGDIEMAVARLIAPHGMGSRFKALGVRSRNLPVLPGFEVPEAGPRS